MEGDHPREKNKEKCLNFCVRFLESTAPSWVDHLPKPGDEDGDRKVGAAMLGAA